MTSTRWWRSVQRSANKWTSSPSRFACCSTNCIKYACPCCDQGVEVAPTSTRIIPRGLLTEVAQAWEFRQVPIPHAAVPYGRAAAPPRRRHRDQHLSSERRGNRRAVQPVVNLLRDPLLESNPDLRGREHRPGGQGARAEGADQDVMWAQMDGTGSQYGFCLCAGARRLACRETVCRHPPRHYAHHRWLQGRQRHCQGRRSHAYRCWVHARRPSDTKAARSPDPYREPVRAADWHALYRAEAPAKDWKPARRLLLRSRYGAAAVRGIKGGL